MLRMGRRVLLRGSDVSGYRVRQRNFPCFGLLGEEERLGLRDVMSCRPGEAEQRIDMRD